MHPEKNDVSIDKLFHWGGKFTITDKYGTVITDAHIRLVGDAEVNRARIFAIRKSSELRKKLKTEDSDERIAFVAAIYELDDKDELARLVAYLNTKKLTQDAVREVRLPQPKELKSTATLEEQEKYQEEVDSYDERRMELINQYVATRMEDMQKELNDRDLLYLQRQCEKLMIDELCEKEMVEKFRDACVYYGSYKDENFKERLFETFDAFDNLPTEVKEQFISYYDSLEINVQDLKKLLVATQ